MMQRKRAFTLVELIVVVVILSVLLTVSSSMYFDINEKSRSAEAKNILAHIRAAEELYRLENIAAYKHTNSLGDLAVDVPVNCSQASHYFSYSVPSADHTHFTARADRCRAGGGKIPGSAYDYNLTINETGVLVKPPRF